MFLLEEDKKPFGFSTPPPPPTPPLSDCPLSDSETERGTRRRINMQTALSQTGEAEEGGEEREKNLVFSIKARWPMVALRETSAFTHQYCHEPALIVHVHVCKKEREMCVCMAAAYIAAVLNVNLTSERQLAPLTSRHYRRL